MDKPDQVIKEANWRPAPIEGDFLNKSILTVEQLSRNDLDQLFQVSRDFKDHFRANRRQELDLARNCLSAALFFESSTRTDLSFQGAMSRLGGSVIAASNGISFSSVYKGENLADTVRTVGCYADVIVLRHPKAGSALLADYYLEGLSTKIGRRPIVINAGDGDGEHPTQAFLDLFTILESKGSADNLSITLVGDLKYGRTVHSLVKLFSIYKLRNLTLNFVSPKSLKLPQSVKSYIEGDSFQINQTDSIGSVIGESDVIYWTRIQEERFSSRDDYRRVKDDFIMTQALLNQSKPDAILMHPLPRKHEMGTEADHQVLDQDGRSIYFNQMENGLFVRMGLLALTLGVCP